MKRIFKEIAGFSLTELMVVIGIMGIVAGVSYPTLKQWLPEYRMKAAARELYSSFQRAKLEAIKRNTYVTVTFNLPISGITYDYVVYVDANRNLEYDGETILKTVQMRNYPNVAITNNTFMNNDLGQPSVAFDPRGLPRNNINGFGAGTVTFTNVNGNSLNVILNSIGNIRLN